MRLLWIILPVSLWLILLVLVAKVHYQRNLFYTFMSIVSLVAIWQLTQRSLTNYLWVVLFSAVIVAMLTAFLQLAQLGDLLFHRYFHQLARIMVLATTCWWLGAIYLTK
ncbi:hypothetical protein [Lacticaseibacillus jixiensis]|uniref:hypothetical protein n=1 Tax=Lacticaseibacillus jixiensis TaxID=3231926 RepID=UPI0036F2FD8B